MALKIEIVSRKTIKPSSPTPENLRIYKLSYLDQLQIRSYIPIIFFYSSTIPKLDKTSNLFKKSLSETLTHMYPLAGRIKDIFSVECNDQGVEYIEAQVSDTMSAVIEHPKIHLLQQLLPPDPQSMSTNPGDQVLLSAQINHFACGGTAFGVLISHRITDLLSACTFLKTWAAIARGENIVGNFVVDYTTMFPPQDVSCLKKLQITKQEECKTKVDRFVFSGSNIAALREKAIKSGSCSQRPSRVVAVTAFIWAAFIAADAGRKNCFMSTTINLRKWIDPPILPHSIGNVLHGVSAMWEPVEESIDYGVLVKRVKDSIESVNADYVKRFADDEYFSNRVRGISEYAKNKDKMRIFGTNSWCRAPIYEIDFGLGKPNWVGTIYPEDNNCVHLTDTSDGEGIEAWVKLSEEDMIKIEQNPEFLAYVSSCESV